MAQQVKAVVARSKGAPVELVTIEVPDPGPGEAVVNVLACGVCHTDLHYREGAINDDFPFLLGHEAAGVVEAVGPGVTGVAPGDFVVLNWRAVCGECRACKRGDLQYCFNTHNATQRMTIAEGPDSGAELTPALGIGAFAEKTVRGAPPDLPSPAVARHAPHPRLVAAVRPPGSTPRPPGGPGRASCELPIAHQSRAVGLGVREQVRSYKECWIKGRR